MPGNKRYTIEEIREIHARKSSSEPKYPCANCNKVFYTRTALAAHQRREAKGGY